jgi:glycosyltransferase involved in cell wall biosynthesis
MAIKTVWNRETYARLRRLLRRERPEVCHFHNTFPFMSPAVLYAAKAHGIPVVVTLHNYRLLCPGATFLRDGGVCEDCSSAVFPWPAVAHGCYRASRAASAATGLMLGTHRLMGTWTRVVDVYIALTAFAREKFVQGGLPAEKVVVKPNFVGGDPGPSGERADFALFVGRLSAEKGIETLLESWRQLAVPMPLKIAGDGPMADAVAAAAARDSRIEWLGRLPEEQIGGLMRHARVLVFPSIWYEGLPLSILEAYANGLPVIASDLGSMRELLADGATGLRFSPGNPTELAGRLAWTWTNRERLAEMGYCARRTFQEHYTAAVNYRRLIEVYHLAARSHSQVMGSAGSGRPARSCTPDCC